MNAATGEAHVFVVDDDAAARRALERLVRSAGWAVTTYPCADEFLEDLPYSGVGCLLLDMQLPGMSGPQLHAKLRASAETLPIIYVSGHVDVPSSIDAMKNGAVDVLLKPADGDHLVRAVGQALSRHAQIRKSAAMREAFAARLAALSEREREVMRHVIGGRLNKQIAADLGISEKTVKTHRARVMEKLGARSVAILVRLCDAAGVSPHGLESSSGGDADSLPRVGAQAAGVPAPDGARPLPDSLLPADG